MHGEGIWFVVIWMVKGWIICIEGFENVMMMSVRSVFGKSGLRVVQEIKERGHELSPRVRL